MTESNNTVDRVEKPSATYDVSRLFNEDTTVEREIIEHLKAARPSWAGIGVPASF
jgi:type I restriction enzyme, R subunit